MTDELITALMLVVAGIHLAPIAGFFGANRLRALYGFEVRDPDLEILMRHRALLFGILGAFFAYAAFVPVIQPIAFAAAAVSVTGFLYLTTAVANYGPAIRKIAIADVIAAVCLICAIVLYVVRANG